MNLQDDDTGLRAAFAQLRSRDRELAQPFARVWTAAQRRVASGRPAKAGYRWVAATGLASILIAVALVYRTVWISTPASDIAADPIAYSPQSVAPEPVALSQWRSPTEFLLVTADRELLRNVPRFGQPAVETADLPDMEI